MKKIFSLFTAIIIFATIFTSCEKEVFTNPNNQHENSNSTQNEQSNVDVENVDLSTFTQEVAYYIDCKEVETDLKNYSTDLLIVERQKIDYINKIITIERQGFTNEQEYIRFGEENHYPLKEELEFVKQMREYIETNKIEEFYETNGELPKGYIEYEANLHSTIFPEKKGVPSLLLGLVLAKESYGMGSHWIAWLKTWPVMLPGWNNTLSSYQPVGLAGVVSFYNRSFYRGHLFTRVQWAMTWYNMYGADNCVSSWFRI